MKFYSPTTGGFYVPELHGSRTVAIIDPAWVTPTIAAADPEHDGQTVEVPDPDAVAPMIEVQNPFCSMPPDVVEVSEETYQVIFAALESGQVIVADANGNPVAADQPGPTAEAIWGKIKQKREEITGGGVMVGTKWYHSDSSSRAKYLGLLRMADAAVIAGGTDATVLQFAGQNISWKTMDGAFVNMTVKLANDVFAAVAGIDFASFAVAEQHRAGMLAADKPSAYDYSANWPAVFGG